MELGRPNPLVRSETIDIGPPSARQKKNANLTRIPILSPWTASTLPGERRILHYSQEPTKSGGGLRERLDNAVHHLLDEPLVIPLAHHPDHRFGARGAYDEAAVAIKAGFGRLDGGPDAGVFERLAALVAHVLEHLRQRIETVPHLRNRQVLPLHHGKQLKGGDAPVAGGGEIGKDDVAGLLAADIEAMLTHVLEHVAVADRRTFEREAESVEVALEPEIG